MPPTGVALNCPPKFYFVNVAFSLHSWSGDCGVLLEWYRAIKINMLISKLLILYKSIITFFIHLL